MPRHHQTLEDMLFHNSAFQDFFAAMTGGTCELHRCIVQGCWFRQRSLDAR